LFEKDLLELSHPGFKVVFYETTESFYMNEVLEYIFTWKQATSSNPAGICIPKFKMSKLQSAVTLLVFPKKHYQWDC
jgi:hypothetical protein